MNDKEKRIYALLKLISNIESVGFNVIRDNQDFIFNDLSIDERHEMDTLLDLLERFSNTEHSTYMMVQPSYSPDKQELVYSINIRNLEVKCNDECFYPNLLLQENFPSHAFIGLLIDHFL